MHISNFLACVAKICIYSIVYSAIDFIHICSVLYITYCVLLH